MFKWGMVWQKKHSLIWKNIWNCDNLRYVNKVKVIEDIVEVVLVAAFDTLFHSWEILKVKGIEYRWTKENNKWPKEWQTLHQFL